MKLNKITSQSNPRFKETLKIKNRRNKYGHTAFLIEGPHLVEMALSTNIQIKKIFFTGVFSEKSYGMKFLRKVSKKTIELYEVADHLLNKLADTETPQGIIAVVTCNSPSLDELSVDDKPLLVVIDGIQDPGNLGSMIRTADAAGADAVVLLPGTCDAFMSKAVRATAGSILNLPIVYSDVIGLTTWLKKKKINITVTSTDAKNSLFTTDLKKSTALVFGNEAHGVSEEIKKAADLIIKIPLYGKAESLNVAASSAICLYEAVRQRKSDKS